MILNFNMHFHLPKYYFQVVNFLFKLTKYILRWTKSRIERDEVHANFTDSLRLNFAAIFKCKLRVIF